MPTRAALAIVLEALDKTMRDKRSWILGVLLAACLISSGCNRSGKNSKFDTLRELVIAGRFEEAIPRLQMFLRKYPDSPNASRAGLFLGKAHLGRGNLAKAAEAFNATIADYPESLEAHKSRYKLGLIALLRDDREQAEQIFDELAQACDGPLAPEAMAMCVYLRGND